MVESEPATPPKEPVDPRHQALLTLSECMSEMQELARQSQSDRVFLGMDHLRRAVRAKLDEYEHPRIPSPREIALMQWAAEHGIPGDAPYAVQGNIITMHRRWMEHMARKIFQKSSRRICLNDVRTAGFRAVMACAWNFDPSCHGTDFPSFARPLVIAAMQHCLAVGKVDLPKQTSIELLLSFIGREPAPEEAPASSPVVASPAVTTDSPSPLPAAAPAAKPVRPAPSATPKPRRDPPQSSPMVATLAPERQSEIERKRRFCDWAKSTYQIPVAQDQFDQAVKAIVEKHYPLANGVVDKTDGLSSFRGGKSAVRREAMRLLPERVRDFDPAGGEHFNQFLTVWLAAELKAFVAGNGKKKKEA
ncbi:MAG: hypothetical protein PHO20_02815 [Candidatus Peribacteraceae bacterium]|nr:hypothetical protein [Candidatus Peribacteraceae bacterium]MDD5739673.1 hypothetical protein [Candidatus Peribacteraceae bacterium]